MLYFNSNLPVIMPKLKEEITKLYYSIGEVAEMFDVSKSLIRFWESEFDLLKPQKNRKGDRRFTQKNLDQFRTIYQLVKEKGYTLEGAKREIKRNRRYLSGKQKSLKSLKKVRGFLEDMKGRL